MKKKWIFAILIIVVLAVVLAIVFVNLFTPKNTTKLAQQVISITTTGYLSPDNKDNQKIDEFMTKVQTNPNLNETEREQIKNYISAYKAFEVMGGFFGRQLVYSKHTSVYSNNVNNIKKSLDDANSKAKAVASYIKGREEVIGQDVDVTTNEYVAQTWRSCVVNVKSLFDNTVSAFSRLTAVYNSCVTSPLMNNDMSKAAFKVANYFASEVKKELEAKDKPVVSTGTQYQSFKNVYFSKANEYQISNYQYSPMAWQVSEDILKAKDLTEYKTDSSSSQQWGWFVRGEIYTFPAGAAAANYDLEVAA